MRLTTVILGAAALTIVSAPAFAADPIPAPVFVPPAPAPEPERGFTWTGGYIGGHAGIGRGAIDNGGTCIAPNGAEIPIHFIIEEPFDDLDWGGPCTWSLFGVGVGAFGPQGPTPNVGEPTGIAGFLGGAQIGFNLQLGGPPFGFVIGAEVAHSWTSLTATLDAEHWAIPIQWNSEFRINHITTATLRAGVAFNRILIYGEGGLALVNATWTNTLGFNDTATDHGRVFGAGIEAALTDSISLFFEWNRVVIPEHDFIGAINFFIPLPTGVRVSSRTDIFKVGFNIGLGN